MKKVLSAGLRSRVSKYVSLGQEAWHKGNIVTWKIYIMILCNLDPIKDFQILTSHTHMHTQIL